jgi:hypothetical protein
LVSAGLAAFESSSLVGLSSFYGLIFFPSSLR